jgi:hypothetical protein
MTWAALAILPLSLPTGLDVVFGLLFGGSIAWLDFDLLSGRGVADTPDSKVL